MGSKIITNLLLSFLFLCMCVCVWGGGGGGGLLSDLNVIAGSEGDGPVN